MLPSSRPLRLGLLALAIYVLGAGQLRLAEMTALFWHCLVSRDGLSREAVGAAVLQAGLAQATRPLRTLLGQILQGDARE